MTARTGIAGLVERTFDALNKEIAELKTENAQVKEQNMELKAEVAHLRKQLNTALDDWGKDRAKNP